MEGAVLLLAATALMVAAIAIMVALSTQSALRKLERQVERQRAAPPAPDTMAVIDAQVARRAGSVSAPPPLPPRDERSPPSRSPSIGPEPIERSASGAAHAAPSLDAPATENALPAVAPEPVPRTLEERLGASLPIWFGAIALALAGVFLVKHFVDRGLLGPGVRVGIAVFAGLALLILAWRVRSARPSIAQGLAAAGVAVLSGAVYAATSLYGFLSPGWGVVAQGLVTALAVYASLRFGPFVALLGIVGGFALPALLGGTTLSTAAMFGYLTLLQIGLAFFGIRRGWWWLPLVGAGAAFLWAFAWSGLRGEGHSILSPFALLAAGLAIASTRRVNTRIGDGLPSVATLVPWLVGALAIGLLLEDLRSTSFGVEHWLWIGGAAIGTLVLAARDRTLAGLPWLVAVIVGVWLFSMSEGLVGFGLADHRDPHRDQVVLGYGLVFALGAFVVGSTERGHSALLAWLPPFATLVALRALVFGAPAWELRGGPGWSAAAVLGGLALIVDRRETGERRSVRASGLVTAAAIAIGCGLFEGVDDRFRSFGLVLLPLGIASIAILRGLAPLLRVVPFATFAALPIVLADQLVEHGRADGLFFSTPSLAFATFAAATFATSRVLKVDPGALRIARLHQSVAIGIAAFEVWFWIVRHFDEVAIPDPGSWMLASFAAGWLCLGQLLFWSAPRWAIEGGTRPGNHVTLAGFVVLVLGPMTFGSPFVVSSSVGPSLFWNALIVAFGSGAVFGTTARRGWASTGKPRRALVAGVVALVSGFLLITTEVRHAFHGEVLTGPWPELGELYTYSALWLLYGIGLLLLGVARQLRPVRLASLAVMLVSVLKVFLIDASHLDGLWRVLSFFGLGVALFGLAWVYQRFVVGRE